MTTAAIERLQAFVRAPQPSHCDVCGDALPQEHVHLSIHGQRALRCACVACGSAAHTGGWQRVDTHLWPVDLSIENTLWMSLGIPINLAFLLHRPGDADPVALFPSPAGLTETPLPMAGWQAVLSAGAERLQLGATQAILAWRLSSPHRYYVASLDVCYEIAGLLRVHWRGLAGGPAAQLLLDRLIKERRHA